MTVSIISISFIYAVLAVAAIVAMYRKKQPAYALLKILASLGFLVIGFLVWQSTGSDLYLAMLPGYILCFLGDVILSVSGEIDNDLKKIPFTLGVGAFLLAHIFYCYRLTELADFHISWPLSISILTLAYTLWSVRSPSFDYGDNRIPSLIYSVFVGAFAGLGINLIIVSGPDAVTCMIASGSALFAVSDLVLANRYFRKQVPSSFGSISLGTYYTAMYLLSVFHLYLI